MKVIVIIPTYNEKNNISILIEKIIGYGYDILVIDDNSPDGTGEIVEQLKLKLKSKSKLEVIHRPQKMGLGTAYIQGFKYALEKSYDYIITMDADLSHNPEYLLQIINKLTEYDLVIGSRYVQNGGIIGWPLYRKLLSFMGNFYARNILSVKKPMKLAVNLVNHRQLQIKDFTSGFMGFRKKVIENIGLECIKSEGYGFLIEMKYRALKMGYKICETPIIFTDRIAGKSKISKKIIFEAIFLCWKLQYVRYFDKI